MIDFECGKLSNRKKNQSFIKKQSKEIDNEMDESNNEHRAKRFYTFTKYNT